MPLSKNTSRILLVIASTLVASFVCLVAAVILFPTFMRSTDELLKRASRTWPSVWNGQPCLGSKNQPLAALLRKSEDEEIIFELKPRMDTCFQGARVKTNRQGFRAEADFSLPKPEGTIRILGLGDSMMFGWGAEEVQTYSEKLERLLQEKWQRPVEFIKTAVPAYNTAMEAAVLEKRGMAYQPDVVILHWCWNDFVLPPFLQQQNPASFLSVSAWRKRINDSFNRFIGGVILPAGLSRNILEDAPGHDYALPPLYQAMVGEAGVGRAFERMLAFLQPRGIPLIVISNINAGTEHQQQFLRQWLSLHRIIQLEMDEKPTWWLSAEDHHLSAFGHDRYAEKLLESITQLKNPALN